MPDPNQKLAPLPVYLRRQIQHTLAAFAIGIGAIGIGIFGYHFIAKLGWTDSLLNASMILSGMGPVDHMNSRAAKLFASAYALFGGLVFMITMGVVITPLVHRLLHRLHLEEDRRRKSVEKSVEVARPPIPNAPSN